MLLDKSIYRAKMTILRCVEQACAHSGKFPDDTPLIVSVHIPKTAGTSFRVVLKKIFGRFLHLDYGNYHPLTSPLIKTYHFSKLVGSGEVDTIKSKVRCIHGHFGGRKYFGLFPEAHFVTWLRFPVDRLYSQYVFQKRSHDPYNHVSCLLHRKNLSFLEYAQLEENRNMQSKMLDGCDLEKFSFIGITEKLDEQVLDFLQIYGFENLKSQERRNVNKGEKSLSEEIVEEVSWLNKDDLELYRRFRDVEHRRRKFP